MRNQVSKRGAGSIRRWLPGPGRPMRIEHEYFRTGALTYLAAWDVHRAKLFGRCEPKTTIGAVDRLVKQVMTT